MTGAALFLASDARVPAANLQGQEGVGFAMAQARLGPGRLLGRGVIREWVARFRIEISRGCTRSAQRG